MREYVLGIIAVLGVVVGWVTSDAINQAVMQSFYYPLFITRTGAFLETFWIFTWKTFKLPKKEDLLKLFVLSLLWFGATYLNLLSLHFTSVSSNEVLTTLMAPWAMVLSVVLMPSERKHWLWKAGSILLSISGTCLIAYADEESSGSKWFGDLFIILSALSYGTYDVCIKVWFPTHTDVRPILMSIGILVSIYTYPLQYIFGGTGFESVADPSLSEFGIIVFTGFLGNFLADYCIAKSVLFLSPLATTIGLTLSVPLAIVIDISFYSATFHWQYILGIVLCVASFVVVSYLESPYSQKSNSRPLGTKLNDY